MTTQFKGTEKREFLRYEYNEPIKYSTVNPDEDKNVAKKMIDVTSKNLSASGILFITNSATIPEISSIVALDLDYKTASICKEIEKRALTSKNKLIGRVVRIEDNEDGTWGVGVAFIKKDDHLSRRLKK